MRSQLAALALGGAVLAGRHLPVGEHQLPPPVGVVRVEVPEAEPAVRVHAVAGAVQPALDILVVRPDLRVRDPVNPSLSCRLAYRLAAVVLLAGGGRPALHRLLGSSQLNLDGKALAGVEAAGEGGVGAIEAAGDEDEGDVRPPVVQRLALGELG